MKVIDAAVKHFTDQPLHSIEIPEWKGEDEQPIRICWRPVTVEERVKLFKGDNKSDADVLIMKALDADGNKLFTLEDKPKLLQYVDSAVTIRISNAILAGLSREVDEVTKN